MAVVASFGGDGPIQYMEGSPGERDILLDKAGEYAYHSFPFDV